METYERGFSLTSRSIYGIGFISEELVRIRFNRYLYIRFS